MKQWFPALSATSNKYNRGVVGVVAGSDQYPGAAVLCVGGARRGGAGYVKYLRQSELTTSLVLTHFPDVVAVPSTESPADAWVVGSGIPSAMHIPENGSLVLDAGALLHVPQQRDRLIVVTPHEGEATAMGFAVGEDRGATAAAMAQALDVIVVLKGYRTCIAAPDGTVIQDEIAGAELSTAGTGDILAGLIGSMLAAWRPQTHSAAHSVVANAVALHGIAGQLARQQVAPVTALDVLEALPKAALNDSTLAH